MKPINEPLPRSWRSKINWLRELGDFTVGLSLIAVMYAAGVMIWNVWLR